MTESFQDVSDSRYLIPFGRPNNTLLLRIVIMQIQVFWTFRCPLEISMFLEFDLDISV